MVRGREIPGLGMTEPVVAYSVKEVLSRIEVKVDKMQADIHQLQMRAAETTAVSRARAALLASSLSAVTAGTALVVVLTHH
jgi:hypothetical protein